MKNVRLEDAIEIRPNGEQRAWMIWLHGLGADGYDLEPVAEMLGIDGVRHVLPHAPVRPVTINGGMAMRAWYDIAAADLEWREDADGMRMSAEWVANLVRTLRAEADFPVILAGFSQGAVISLAAASLGVDPLGVVALSGYVPQWVADKPENLAKRRVFMAHGSADTVIPLALAESGAQLIREAGAELEWRIYPMPHAICTEEIADLRAVVMRWLG